MGSPEELEGRVTALETQMRDVRQDAAAARVLAGGADRDVSALTTRLDADRRLLTALRETQVEHGQRLDSLESEVRQGFSEVRERFAEVHERFSEVREAFGIVATRFTTVEAGQASLDAGQANLEAGQASLDARQANLEAGQARLEAGQAMILDLLRRRNGHDEGPSPSAE